MPLQDKIESPEYLEELEQREEEFEGEIIPHTAALTNPMDRDWGDLPLRRHPDL